MKHYNSNCQPKGVEIFENWKLTDAEKENPIIVLESFSNYFEPKSKLKLPPCSLSTTKNAKNNKEKIASFLIRLSQANAILDQ